VCQIGSWLRMDLPGGTTEGAATPLAIQPLAIASPSGSQALTAASAIWQVWLQQAARILSTPRLNLTKLTTSQFRI